MNSKRRKGQQGKEMVSAFEEQSKEVLTVPEKFKKPENTLKVGFESEIAIVKEGIIKGEEIEKLRDDIVQALVSKIDVGVELGAGQIEFRTPPVDIVAEGFHAVANIYSKTWETVKREVGQERTSILRIGANPFLSVNNPPRTNREKYRKVPDFHKKYQRHDISMLIGRGKYEVDVGDPAIVSLFQSFQVNIEAKSLEDAVDKMNRGFMIGPFILAVSANARYLELRDTGICDIRMLAWEMSHDTRTPEEVRKRKKLRIGLPERYFLNLEDYFNRIKKFPFILYQPESALQIGIGLHWLDMKVKFIGNSAVVEFRLISTQPTIEEELGVTLFFLGRLLDSQARREQLLPMPLVEMNRMEAMLKGLYGKFWFLDDDGKTREASAKEVVKIEIQRALHGLHLMGIGDLFYLNLIAERLKTGSPSDKLWMALIERKQNTDFTETLKLLNMLIS